MPFNFTQKLKRFFGLTKKAVTDGLNSAAFLLGGIVVNSWENKNNVFTLINSYDVFSVTDRIADALASIDIEVYQKTADRKALKHYQQKSYSDIFKRVAKVKALQEVPESNPLYKLLERPNSYLSEREFFRLTALLYLISGEVYWYKSRTLRGEVESLHIFTGADTTIKITGQFPYKIISYNFSFNGREVLTNIDPKDVVVIKNASPVYDQTGSHLRGFSPLKPGRDLIDTNTIADNRSAAMLKNGGVPGIIFMEEADLGSAPEYSKWKTDMQKFFRDDDNAGVPMPMAGKIGYVQTGLKMADLQLIERQKMGFDKLLNLYKLSNILFNSNDASTESNVQEARKAMYLDAVIPCADAIKDAINKYLVPDFDKSLYVDFDFSEVAVLQADLLKTMTAISSMPVSLTGNELRALMKYEVSDAENMDIPLLKQGYSPIDQLDILPAPGAGLP